MDGGGKVEESGNGGSEWSEMRVIDKTCRVKLSSVQSPGILS